MSNRSYRAVDPRKGGAYRFAMGAFSVAQHRPHDGRRSPRTVDDSQWHSALNTGEPWKPFLCYILLLESAISLNATDAYTAVARTWARARLRTGDTHPILLGVLKTAQRGYL
jgi:hypothetical protein